MSTLLRLTLRRRRQGRPVSQGQLRIPLLIIARDQEAYADSENGPARSLWVPSLARGGRRVGAELPGARQCGARPRRASRHGSSGRGLARALRPGSPQAERLPVELRGPRRTDGDHHLPDLRPRASLIGRSSTSARVRILFPWKPPLHRQVRPRGTSPSASPDSRIKIFIARTGSPSWIEPFSMSSRGKTRPWRVGCAPTGTSPLPSI